MQALTANRPVCFVLSVHTFPTMTASTFCLTSALSVATTKGSVAALQTYPELQPHAALLEQLCKLETELDAVEDRRITLIQQIDELSDQLKAEVGQ